MKTYLVVVSDLKHRAQVLRDLVEHFQGLEPITIQTTLLCGTGVLTASSGEETYVSIRVVSEGVGLEEYLRGYLFTDYKSLVKLSPEQHAYIKTRLI